MSQLDYAGLRAFKRRLEAEYASVSMQNSDDKAIRLWLRELGLRMVRIIDPIPDGMDKVEHLFGKTGVVWFSYEHTTHVDTWHFHPDDANTQMLFKLAWLK